jgi:hypothetical protein
VSAKNWLLTVTTAASVGLFTIAMAAALARQRSGNPNEIPDLIRDCQQRIETLDRELQRLRQPA